MKGRTWKPLPLGVKYWSRRPSLVLSSRSAGTPPPWRPQRLLAQVGGEDVDLPVGHVPPEHLVDENGHRVGFLAAGATGAPDAQLPAPLALLVLDQPRQNRFAEHFPDQGVSEERGHVDGDGLDQAVVLGGVGVQPSEVFLVLQAKDGQAPLQPAFQHRTAIPTRSTPRASATSETI